MPANNPKIRGLILSCPNGLGFIQVFHSRILEFIMDGIFPGLDMIGFFPDIPKCNVYDG